ncbi:MULTISPECIES: hypothetical protein [Cupriavidus]
MSAADTARGWHPISFGALILALAGTGTALFLSTLAGWQRGGWLVDRIAWVAMGGVLVLSAHLLPALTQAARRKTRWVGGALWAACMVAAGYGHATFFLWSQQHAGEARVSVMASTSSTTVVTEKSSSATPPGRSLSAIATERARVVTALATVQARHCDGGCPLLQARRESLTATLDALAVEAEEVRRWEAAEDRQDEERQRETTRRDAARHDPVIVALAAWLGISPAGVEFLGAMILAGSLEGVACYGWLLTLASRVPAMTAVTESHQIVLPPVSPPTSTSHADTETDLSRLHRAIAIGELRPTVAEIRSHLRCSQARAAALRRQLAAHHPTA